jgi:hypothetical protein|tara:strand:+ start:2242 stop:2454 length:213 start_codon:yes stop_codon:yes gene_type:complete
MELWKGKGMEMKSVDLMIGQMRRGEMWLPLIFEKINEPEFWILNQLVCEEENHHDKTLEVYSDAFWQMIG